MDRFDRKDYITAIIGLLGVIIGGGITIYGSYMLYQDQQHDEQKNIAKAFDIDITKVNESITPIYDSYAKHYPDSRIYPGLNKPFYSLNNGLYPIFAHDISRFDYNLSSEIFEFYIDIYAAEEDRQYVAEYMKHPSNNNSNESIAATQRLYDMIKIIKKCHDQQIPSIMKQLKEIEESKG